MRRGLEADFDPDKMKPGEWAVSTDKQYVRMCFSVGVCVRMATYDAFEADVAKIQDILEEVQTIEEAVTRINTEISEKANAVAEYTEQAKGYRDETKQFRDGAEASATNAKSSEDKAKVSETNAKVSETNAKISEQNAQRVAESLPEDYTELSKAFYNTAIKQKAVGDNIHVTDSANGKNVEFGLYGKATQDGEPTPDNPIEIVVSGSDGSVEAVSENEDSTQSTNAIIPTPNGLCGIKVSSGGNYTDENGQQWICDEIVKYADGSGKRVQRIGKAVFDGSSDEGWSTEQIGSTEYYRTATSFIADVVKGTSTNNDIPNALSSALIAKSVNQTYLKQQGFAIMSNGKLWVYSESHNTSDVVSLWTAYLAENPMTLYYELATPIITDISAEEIAEIEKLHTFYPVTNISNDADCGMSIKYLCDSKNYIDNRLAQIEAVLINNI